MEFQQLRYFLETARQEHMGKASKVLSVSQSALSHAIGALEDDLDVKLFIREGRRIFLSDHGRLLMERGRRLLLEKSQLEEELRSSKSELHGTVRIAAPIAINSFFVGPAWARASAAHGKIRAEISSIRSIDLLPKILLGEMDVGICFGPQAHPLLISQTLSVRKLLVVVRKGVLKRKRRSEKLKLLSSLPGSLPNGLLGFGFSELHPFFERHDVRPTIELLYDNYEVALSYVENKLAWALLPDWVAERHKGCFESLLADKIYEPLEITLVRSKSRPLTAVSQLLADEIQLAFR